MSSAGGAPLQWRVMIMIAPLEWRAAQRKRERSNAGGLCRGRCGIGRRHGGVAAVGDRRLGDPARGGADRLVSVDPHPRRHAQAAAQSAGELELHDRAGEELGRAPPRLAARPHARRHLVDQRHALCARRAGRLRQLGADGLPRLELRRRAAVLPQGRDLRAGRRSRGARPGRPAQGRGLPHHPAAHPPLREGGAGGGLPVQSRPQRQAALRRRLFADDAARPLARLDGADLPARGAEAAEPPGRDRRADRQAVVRGQALRRRRVHPRRQHHHGQGQPRGDRLGRHGELAAHPADLRHRPGRAPAERWAFPVLHDLARRRRQPGRPLRDPRGEPRAGHAHGQRAGEASRATCRRSPSSS